MSEELDRAHFESAKRTLVDQMVLYGVVETQAIIQVDSLIEATTKVSARAAVVALMESQPYRRLMEDSAKLAALKAAGVDNWEGYSVAMRDGD